MRRRDSEDEEEPVRPVKKEGRQVTQGVASDSENDREEDTSNNPTTTTLRCPDCPHAPFAQISHPSPQMPSSSTQGCFPAVSYAYIGRGTTNNISALATTASGPSMVPYSVTASRPSVIFATQGNSNVFQPRDANWSTGPGFVYTGPSTSSFNYGPPTYIDDPPAPGWVPLPRVIVPTAPTIGIIRMPIASLPIQHYATPQGFAVGPTVIRPRPVLPTATVVQPQEYNENPSSTAEAMEVNALNPIRRPLFRAWEDAHLINVIGINLREGVGDGGYHPEDDQVASPRPIYSANNWRRIREPNYPILSPEDDQEVICLHPKNTPYPLPLQRIEPNNSPTFREVDQEASSLHSMHIRPPPPLQRMNPINPPNSPEVDEEARRLHSMHIRTPPPLQRMEPNNPTFDSVVDQEAMRLRSMHIRTPPYLQRMEPNSSTNSVEVDQEARPLRPINPHFGIRYIPSARRTVILRSRPYPPPRQSSPRPVPPQQSSRRQLLRRHLPPPPSRQHRYRQPPPYQPAPRQPPRHQPQPRQPLSQRPQPWLNQHPSRNLVSIQSSACQHSARERPPRQDTLNQPPPSPVTDHQNLQGYVDINNNQLPTPHIEHPNGDQLNFQLRYGTMNPVPNPVYHQSAPGGSSTV
ncbi:uncharacterized protein LOC128998983 [Macrosteles quadrilineatus]|uniref:uncharacterized protein LOC128998983 n=1 Tax=Macrosteles quadrilineatus TaxID=74068 RepID=UPI0023E15711|nr:uncharacterized protein LOC128998983 [Macrosteles quadrilineatus]